MLPDAWADLVWAAGAGAFIAGPDITATLVTAAPGTVIVGARSRPGAGAGAASTFSTSRALRWAPATPISPTSPRRRRSACRARRLPHRRPSRKARARVRRRRPTCSSARWGCGLIARARLRADPGAQVAADATAPAVAPDPFGLTDRERQVLGLVAEGATNREIGATLFMAEKTASVHVSRILAKLDVRSRTEAAALAHRNGLAEA